MMIKSLFLIVFALSYSFFSAEAGCRTPVTCTTCVLATPAEIGSFTFRLEGASKYDSSPVAARLIGRAADDSETILGVSPYSDLVVDTYHVGTLQASVQTAGYVSYWLQTYDSSDQNQLFNECPKVQIAIAGSVPSITSLTCNRADCLARKTGSDLNWEVRFNGVNIPPMSSFGAGYIPAGFPFTPSVDMDFVRSMDETHIAIGAAHLIESLPSTPLYWLDIAGVRFSGNLPIQFVDCFPGTGKVMVGGVWNQECAACTGNTYSTQSTGFICTSCPTFTVANAEKTACDPLPPFDPPVCQPNQFFSGSKCFSANEARVPRGCSTASTVVADSDCGGPNMGFCVGGSRCSCASGHGSQYDAATSSFICSVSPPIIGGVRRAAQACDPRPVDPAGSDFSTSVANFAFNNGLVDITITAPYENFLDASNRAGATRIKFGSSDTACDYPTGTSNMFVPVAAADGSCFDSYTATMADWALLRSCGPWTTGLVGDNTEFSTEVTVERDYQVTQGRVSTVRTASSSHYLTISFPTVGSVDSVTTVNIFGGAPDLQNNMVLSSIRYSIPLGRWVATFRSSTVYPYRLSQVPGPLAIVEFDSGNDVAEVTDISDCQSPAPATIGDQCLQTITVDFTPGCAALNFVLPNYLSLGPFSIQYECMAVATANGNCPISGPQFISTTADTMRINNLVTSNACPDTRVDIPAPAVEFFSTNTDYSAPFSAFLQGDQIPFRLSLTASTIAGRTDTITNTQILEVTVTTLNSGTALKGTAAVSSTGNYIDKVTAPTACSAADRACFVVSTAVAPFDGAEAVGEGQSRQHTFRITFEVTYAGSVKKRFTTTVTAPTLRGASVTRLTLAGRTPIAQGPAGSGTVGNGSSNSNVIVWVLVAVIVAVILGAAVGIFIWKYRAHLKAKKDLL